MANNIHTISKSNSKHQDFTPSSLLIPAHLLKYFSMRVATFGGTKYYFKHLIVIYARNLRLYGLEQAPTKWKNEYQESGLKLQKKNFKPQPESWEEFRHLGFFYGLAMCKLFTVLLELEYKRWEEAGFPDDFCETPPVGQKDWKKRMNSSSDSHKDAEFVIKSILNSSKYTLLIRCIDFSRRELGRAVLIRQE